MDQESNQYGVNEGEETVSHAEFNALDVRDHETTYRWSPEDRRRLLDTKAECEEDIKAGRRGLRRIEQQGPRHANTSTSTPNRTTSSPKQVLEPDQDEDTEGISKGEETTVDTETKDHTNSRTSSPSFTRTPLTNLE